MALGATLLAVVAGAAAPATAATVVTPAKPASIRLAAATGSSFTVTSARAAYATGYRVFASSTKSDVYMVNILARARRSGVSTSPRVTMGGLPYTSAPYYYRVEAINGTKARWSDIQTGYVRPDTPSTTRATGAASTGLSLAWGGRTAGRYVITQATNATMTAGVRSYSITSQAHRFTPYDLKKGSRYYFRVRAYNGPVASSPSAQTQLVAPARGQNVRVLTYNVLHRAAEGTREGGGETVAPWSQRRTTMVALIHKENPDVIGLQEAGDWVGAVKGPRVVDDLRARLGGYTLAQTEVAPGQRGWFRTFRYILFRASTYRAVGTGGHWVLAPSRFAAYQELQNRQTGAKFLAVSVHLSPGAGRAADLGRQAETQKLLGLVHAFQAKAHVPVVYLGDFNSHEGHPLDGPGAAFRASGAEDADEVAQTRGNRQYNSANQYLRSPMTGHWDIDHVYAPAGVAVRHWEIALTLSRGRFVGAIPSDHNPVVADVVLPY